MYYKMEENMINCVPIHASPFLLPQRNCLFFFPSTCKFVYVCVQECVCLRPPASAASCFNFPQDPGRKKKNLLSAASVAHSTLSILCYYVYGGKSIPALLWDTMKPRKHLACRDRMAEKKILQEKHPRRKKRKKKPSARPPLRSS